jgi:hypothetical protein
VVSIDDVRGVLDVRAAIDPVTHAGHATLVDGTVFDVSLAGDPPALPSGVASVDEATLAACSGPDSACGRIDVAAPGATRVRITTPLRSDVVTTAGGLVLHFHAPQPLRVRWDVVVR